MQKIDAEKNRSYVKKHYYNNKQKYLERNKKRYAAISSWMREYKKTLSCIECGENHPATLDFHHRDRTEKEIEVSKIANTGWGTTRIKEEINKCDVLCANCHRKLHWNEKEAQLAQLVEASALEAEC